MRKIYIDADIVTVDEQLPSAEAMIVDSGLIEFVGSKEEALKLRGEGEVVSMDGRTILPGFIDPHSHMVMASLYSGFVNLAAPPAGTVKSIEDIQRILRGEIKKRGLKKGKNIIGYSYDNALFAEGRNITKFDLDEISREHGILIMHQSGHVGCCNSYVLNKKKITEESVAPEGGAYGRVPGTREPNGQLEETAMHKILMTAVLGSLKLWELPSKIRAGSKLYASNGITTAQEGAIAGPMMPLMKMADKRGWLGIDVVGYFKPSKPKDFKTFDKNAKWMVQDKDRKFRLGGVKYFLDGSPQAKTAWLSKPYHIVPDGQPEDYRGYPTVESSEEVKDVYREAVRRNLQVLTHCNGDQASQEYIDCYSAVKKELGVTKDLRPVMIHAQTVREDQLDQMAEMKMIPSYFHDHTFYWGDWHMDSVFGPERGSRISPLKSSLDRGMVFTTHQDTPVVPPNMIQTIWSSVNRKTRTGRDIGPEYRISPLEAIKAVTINGAYQYFEEDSKGSITPGKRADLVVLDKNPLKVEPMDIIDIRVVQTIKDGEVIY